MTKVYELTIKETGVIDYYTSLTAISLEHDKSVINLSPNSIHDIKFKDNIYENRKIIIRKFYAKSTTDVKEAVSK